MRRHAGVATVLLAALGVAIAAGCVGDDPVLVAPAAGGDAGNAGDAGDAGDAGKDEAARAAQRFIGTWTTGAGAQTISGCPAAQTQTNISVTLDVKKGETSDIVMTNTLAPSCGLAANVAGDTATLLPGQRCVATFPGGVVDTYDYAATSTFKLTADGTQGTMQLYATITGSPSGLRCSFAEVDPYTKR